MNTDIEQLGPVERFELLDDRVENAGEFADVFHQLRPLLGGPRLLVARLAAVFPWWQGSQSVCKFPGSNGAQDVRRYGLTETQRQLLDKVQDS